MSKVIGFRLDNANPREAQALLILRRWQEGGYSTRHILTEALLRLEQSDEDRSKRLPVDEIVNALNQVREQLELLQQVDHHLGEPSVQEQAALAEAFLVSIRQAARPGMQLND